MDQPFQSHPSGRFTIATFNLENWGTETADGPSLNTRIELTRPWLLRLEADVLCLQEINAQGEATDRKLSALEKLLSGTPYAEYRKAVTTVQDGDYPYAERNLLTLSRFEISGAEQYRNDYAPAPAYRTVTEQPKPEKAQAVRWERPIQHVRLAIPGEEESGRATGSTLHVINLHLKSKRPTDIPGQKVDPYTWKSASGWAEGYFLSSIKRVGQALEVRMLVDSIFDSDEGALIVVCGDFNADAEDVPLKAIRGEVEEHGNGALAGRVMIPSENSIPDSSRYSLLYRGKGEMIDHILMSRGLLPYYRGAEVHNELLHDESVAYATDQLYPESDHAPVLACFEL